MVRGHYTHTSGTGSQLTLTWEMNKLIKCHINGLIAQPVFLVSQLMWALLVTAP